MLCAFIAAGSLACIALMVVVMACRPVVQNLNPNEAVFRYEQRRKPGDGGSQWRELSDEDRHGFMQVWWSVREQYEYNPKTAVKHADLLISDLMEDCGCPVSLERRQRPAYIDETLTSKFCVAHQLTLQIQQGRFTRDEIEHAMRLYAVLLDQLLG